MATHYVIHTSKASADKPAMVLITGNYSRYLHSNNSKKSKQSKKSGTGEGKKGGRGHSSATDILIVNFSVTAGIKKKRKKSLFCHLPTAEFEI